MPHRFSTRRFSNLLSGNLLFSNLLVAATLLAIASPNAKASAKSQDFQVFSTPATSAIQPLFLPLPGLDSNRWPDGIIEWWYNPQGQTISTASAIAAIEKATRPWEGVAGVNFIYMGETAQALSGENDDKLVVGWLDGTTFNRQIGDFSAYTYIWWNGQYIEDGEISINGGDEDMQDMNILQGIMTHEFGHVLGLDHSDDTRSIMFARPYHSGEYQKFLRSDDRLAASTLYPQPCLASHSAEVDSALNISIPVIRWNDNYLSATLEHTGNGLVFSLAGYAYISDSANCHAEGLLQDDLSLYLPAVSIDGEKLAADLNYLGDGFFEVSDYQWLTQIGSEQAASDSRFGAIARGSSGNWGYAYNYRSQSGANDAALEFCGPLCSIIVEAEDECLALASGSGNSYGWARYATTDQASARALEECNQRSDSACTLTVAFCANQ